jgi:chitinase
MMRGLCSVGYLLLACLTLGTRVVNANRAQHANLFERHPKHSLLGRQSTTTSDPDYSCTATTPCSIGCCGPLDADGNGVCGLGPTFCGDGCTSSCNYKSECDPGWGIQWSNATDCPLNVCCSTYGFCGTTSDFCGSAVVSEPQCDASANSTSGRTIGYYEGWNWQRSCGTMTPDEIPLGYYTHINFAFSLIDPDSYRLVPMDDITGTLYSAVSSLKVNQPDLEVWIAVGGWAMNDPGAYTEVFSNLAGSQAAQDEFFEALVTFMVDNDFDGVDIDWEYPSAPDRGGRPADLENYVTFVSNLRNRLNALGTPKGISITLPSSYWYMQGFDIVNLEPHVDWFNVMTYDIRKAPLWLLLKMCDAN